MNKNLTLKMNDKILDAPFEESPKTSIEDYLEKGENIIWTEHPKLNLPFTYGFGVGVFIICAALIMNPALGYLFGLIGYFITIPAILILHIALTIKKNIKKENTIYAITETRVFFQFTKNLKKEIHHFPFSQITHVMVTGNGLYKAFGKNYGTVYLSVRNPHLVPFTTYNFEIHERRHQPTFELIQKPEKIAELIRQGMRTK